MSAISSVGSSLTAMLQGGARRVGGDRDGDGDGSGHGKAGFASALKAVGVDQGKIDDIQAQVQAAVQKVKDSGGDRAAFKDAVDGVLKQNGVDVAKFKDQLKTQAREHHGGHRHTAAATTQNSPSPAAIPKAVSTAAGGVDVLA